MRACETKKLCLLYQACVLMLTPYYLLHSAATPSPSIQQMYVAHVLRVHIHVIASHSHASSTLALYCTSLVSGSGL